MGCSSSSAQTVDQEKRPSTKPEESNGDTLAVQNGTIAETPEHNMSVGTLVDDLHQGVDNGAEALLVVMEIQEEKGSGEDLLTDLEPKPDPITNEKPGLGAGPLQASSDLDLADLPVEAAKPIVEDDKTTMGVVKMVRGEVNALEKEAWKKVHPVQDDGFDVPAKLETKAERPTIEVERVQADFPPAIEQASSVPVEASQEADKTVVELGVTDATIAVPDEMLTSLGIATENSPQVSSSVTHESPALTEAPSNEVEPPTEASVEDSATTKSFDEPPSEASVEDSATTKSFDEPPSEASVEDSATTKSFDEPPSEASVEDSAITKSFDEPPSEASVEDSATTKSFDEPPSETSVEDSATTKSFEVKEAVIDAGIAVATIPEMSPSVLATNETQAEQQPPDQQSNSSFVTPTELAPHAGPSCPAESTSQASTLGAKEQVPVVASSSTLLLESSPKEVSDFGASPPSVAKDVELPVAEPTQTEIEANSPVTAPDQACDPLNPVPTAAECHQDLEKERAKKED
ncbi:uncharacterized protein LOC144073244 [Stigmatopora argus]